jgi:TRAP-type C4-dicarboxylate transport system permease small subunit
MFQDFCQRVMRAAEIFTGVLFFGLICAVALQVVARNILQIPILWTSDVAQLLFAWLIFVGAAIGLRQGAHYFVDILPPADGAFRRGVTWFGIAAGAVVIFILVTNGWALTMARARGEIQSIGISRLWLYVPIPISGVMMALFLAEIALKQWRGEEA